jgi:hypothetical protein
MTIEIIPFTVKPIDSLKSSLIEEEEVKRNASPINYWGVYLDDKQISFVSSRDLAEKTKLWMEKWLTGGV